jgi:nitrate reductase NapE component
LAGQSGDVAPNPTQRLRLWQFLFAALALPPLLAVAGAACWLIWICLQAGLGTQGAITALAVLASLVALLRRRTGMGIGAALSFVALAGLVGVVWLAFAMVGWALMVG